jgi:hypothetical protein
MRINDYQWIPIKAGYIIFSSSQAYFLNIGVGWLGTTENRAFDGEVIEGNGLLYNTYS